MKVILLQLQKSIDDVLTKVSTNVHNRLFEASSGMLFLLTR